MSAPVPTVAIMSSTSPLSWAAPDALDSLGRPLADLTFTVVDLETTGGSPAKGSWITEVGAVKVRGGEVLGEFQTLVRPPTAIPPFIAQLTGITDAMVVDAPGIESVLPSFLDFAAGSVLVAHNAPFDIGFLKHFARSLDHAWPAFEVLDTVPLARRIVTRDEAPNCKLESLARLFGATTTPNHRALADARATVDVMHALLGRLGGQGVQTLEELRAWNTHVSSSQRGKRHLADGLPEAPGVYVFEDDRGRPLYVGTSRNVRRRVRTYFTASETRSRMGEMLLQAERVTAVECATPLEAQVRELRLIATHSPRYNRRSRNQSTEWYVRTTNEHWPRLSVVRSPGEAPVVAGPFRRRDAAERHVEALHEAFSIRECGGRLPVGPSRSACALHELGRCNAPCEGLVERVDYIAEVDRVHAAMCHDPGPVLDALTERMTRCAEAERYEEAGEHRDRAVAFVRASERQQRLDALTSLDEVIAARREDDGRWAVHVVRQGRLADAGVMPPGVDAHRFVAALRASAETVSVTAGRARGASTEESECVLRWLEQPGVRLVDVHGDWTWPVSGAAARRGAWLPAEEARTHAQPFDSPRDTRTLSRNRLR